jgi:Fic family protein
MAQYIYELPKWPAYEYDLRMLMPKLEAVLSNRGILFGKLSALGFEDLQETQLAAISAEIVKSSEIEGERLNLDFVRGSVARWLGMSRGGVPGGDYYIDGVVAMAMDASQNYASQLTDERIFNWHAALFPSGRNIFGKLRIGMWRDDAKGPMQVVSKLGGRERVHYEAPPASKLDDEMRAFLDWFENADEPSNVLKAGIAHLWFVTIHPLDDGNGRIGRNILDMALARSDERPYRCYSVSAQILKERESYYDALQAAQSGNGDYNSWLDWYLGCFNRAIEAAIGVVGGAMVRTRFWQIHQAAALNERQHRIVSRMLMGIEGRMSNKKYAKMGKCSDATATRDLGELVAKGILLSDGAGGRSAGYILTQPPEER